MSKFFSDVCNLEISRGTLCSLLKRFAQKVEKGKWLEVTKQVLKSMKKKVGSELFKTKVLLILHF